MKYLIDENLSPLIAQLLRDAGIDSWAVSEHSHTKGISDSELFDQAIEEERVVVTNDIGDLRSLASALFSRDGSHYGLVFISSRRARRSASADIAKALIELAKTNPGGIKNREYWLT